MSRNILKEIIINRKKDIKLFGYENGCIIPEKRQRNVHPFLAERGVILEVKRSSPSKGSIAPELDAYATAYEYALNGAKAISCLTEKRYFCGTLNDLMNVCAAVDAYEKETGRKGPAVLRKDFLFDTKDVEIAYRAGADAVLLIARILSEKKMLSMAEKAEELGISVLIEIRKKSDLKKLQYVMERVKKKNIVCGVNSRDLKNFTIDMLVPAVMLKKIQSISQDARVVFESGILSPRAAAFAGSLGFSGILLGEAAAKNPSKASAFIDSFEHTVLNENGRFWLNYASKIGKKSKPFVKICGNTNVEDAVFAAEKGLDFLGFIMWPQSKRNVSPDVIREIRKNVKDACDKQPEFVGVIVEPEGKEAEEAYKLIKEGVLDVIQVHTFEAAKKFISNKELASLPHYCAVNISSKEDLENLDELAILGEPRILVDAQTSDKIGGTGKTIDENLLFIISQKYRLWIAGGLNLKNIRHIRKTYKPELIDLVSSLEKEPGIKDEKKVGSFLGRI